jgi:hypothetical protein
MAKINIIKNISATVLSKTLSGEDCIVSIQEEQGKVHTIYFSKEESLKIDLGDKLKVTVEKADQK